MRVPKINSTFINKHYKSSTILRLKDHLNYKNQININRCPIITKWLDKIYELGGQGHVQDAMFEYIHREKGENKKDDIKIISKK